MTPEVEPVRCVDLPVGTKVTIIGDLALRRVATPSSDRITTEVAASLDQMEGPGVVVLNGSFLDLLGEPSTPAAAVMAAHPRLLTSLRRFASGEGRHVLVLPGALDRRLAWDERARAEVIAATGACVALAAELTVATSAGPAKIRVEPGTRFDERFQFEERPAAADSPLGVHLVSEVVPALSGRWTEGAADLADVADIPRFLTSRLLYRRLGPWLWLLLVPFVLALAVKLPLAGRLDATLHSWPRRLDVFAATTVLDVVLVIVTLGALVARAWRVVAGTPHEGGDDSARAEARALVGGGFTGLVVSHGRRAELRTLGSGFFAATGASRQLVRERRGRLGLPSVFVPERDTGWLEIEGGARLHVRLWRGAENSVGATALERLASTRLRASPTSIVASWPGESWPARRPPLVRRTRIRRRASAAILLAGLLDLASALTPPLEDRLAFVLRAVPLAVPQTADALVALMGLGMIGLAWGVRRGQRSAWRVVVVLLSGTVALHLLKGGDVEEAAVSLAVAAYLVSRRAAFTARSHLAGLRRGLAQAVGIAATTMVVASAAIEVVTARRHARLPIGSALAAAAERFLGFQGVALPDRLDDFVSPSLVAVGAGLLVWLVVLAVRPAIARRSGDDVGARARALVARWGTGTLDYFALRDDKEVFLTGSSVVAYAVHGSVCLVSPDPIGPVWERDEAWQAFRAFADDQGWTVAVLGAGEDWLATYAGYGMQHLYVGDEAVVDVRHFSLDGGRHKALRQAVNRVANRGYTITFADPATADAELQAAVHAVMARSRRGEVERGFSMTLGRVFDPHDEGLLLAACRAPDGRIAAVCQFVPAPGAGGYSLDVMRRDTGEHPNGLFDFVVVRTIEHLRDHGADHLSLNFATMRGVLAGERATGLFGGLQRWVLSRMSASMQIESLWRFNAKFDPQWRPRYVVYDTAEHAVPVAFAIARAESLWELPAIGRVLGRRGTPATAGDEVRD